MYRLQRRLADEEAEQAAICPSMTPMTVMSRAVPPSNQPISSAMGSNAPNLGHEPGGWSTSPGPPRLPGPRRRRWRRSAACAGPGRRRRRRQNPRLAAGSRTRCARRRAGPSRRRGAPARPGLGPRGGRTWRTEPAPAPQAADGVGAGGALDGEGVDAPVAEEAPQPLEPVPQVVLGRRHAPRGRRGVGAGQLRRAAGALSEEGADEEGEVGGLGRHQAGQRGRDGGADAGVPWHGGPPGRVGMDGDSPPSYPPGVPALRSA